MEQETTITFKCTNEEKKQMKKIAKEKHLTLSAYIRVACLGSK